MKLVNLGCGPNAKLGHWLDYDGSWNAWINLFPTVLRRVTRAAYALSGQKAFDYPRHVRYLNVNRRFPFKSETVDGIYASHVWEHLYYENARKATHECHRVLRHGGIVRLVVPDLRVYCERYIAFIGTDTAAMELHEALMYRKLRREKSALLSVYNGLTEFHSHKFMYDEAALIRLMREAGFLDPKVKGYLESALPHLEEVEFPERMLDGNGFAVEAVKD